MIFSKRRKVIGSWKGEKGEKNAEQIRNSHYFPHLLRTSENREEEEEEGKNMNLEEEKEEGTPVSVSIIPQISEQHCQLADQGF